MPAFSRSNTETYLRELGMGTSLIEKGLTLYDEYEAYLSEAINYVFISEYVDDDGNRIYESIWFLTDTLMAEAHEITSDGHGDIVPLGQGLTQVDFSRKNFDLTSATTQSRFRVSVTFDRSGLKGNFKASSENCAHLLTILRDYLLPRVK